MIMVSHPLDNYINNYPSSGEINSIIDNPEKTINKIKQHYESNAKKIEYIDGLSMEFEQWRFNIRCSNTEPVVRLNVESRGNSSLMQEKTKEILKMINMESEK